MLKVTDYQIVQRDKNNEAKVCFSGKIPENAPDTAVIYGRVYTENENIALTDITKCKKENGQWYIDFTLPAGGLYTFEARMNNVITEDPYDGARLQIVRHFGVGDLYLLTGQSNMSGYGRDIAYDPPEIGVHLYKNNGKWDLATHPLNDSIDTIYPENEENGTVTSPALSFGRILKNKINLPIGLIQSSLGGSPLSKWTPEEEGSLYRAMMRRIDVVGKVKGAIWYQGCSDANPECYNTYYDRFKRMVEIWREKLGNIPIITVQLNRWAGNRNEEIMLDNDRFWGTIRDAQRRLADDVDGIYIVPCHDLPMSDGIHNNSEANVIIGGRLAYAAAKYIYGMPGHAAPTVRRVELIDESHLYVYFDKGVRIATMDARGDGIDVEDEFGFIKAKNAWGQEEKLYVELERPCKLPAKFHAFWRAELPPFVFKDRVGLPMLACYGVEIEQE